MTQQKIYKVGIYARLSKENARDEESLSIENQKLILTKHVRDNGWDLVEIYCDDGFSGANQDRPALQKMLQDVKEGYINTILIKDLSRLGRNYIDMGHLAEEFLPEHNCELISLAENIDDMVALRNIFNEHHSRETSKKVKAVKDMLARSGKYVGSFPPYGYRKSDTNKHLLIPDEPAASIVRNIFTLRSQGMGLTGIAHHLNNMGVIPPRDYYYQKRDDEVENPFRMNHSWNINTIRTILENEAYIGNIVSLKKGTLSFRSHKVMYKPETEWIRVEDTHEPLIDMELWNRVRDIAAKRYRPRKKSDGSVSIFCGLVYCAECGFKMRSATQKKMRKNGTQYTYTSFLCGTYSRSGRTACSAHSIGESKLYNIVLEQIRNHSKIVALNKKHIAEDISEKLYGELLSDHRKRLTELQELQDRSNMLNKFIQQLYEDRVNGVISVSTFNNLMNNYNQEYEDHQQKIWDLENHIRNFRPNESNASKWVNLIKEYSQLEVLDTQILLSLVERIVINEVQIDTDKLTKDVKIIYKHVGDLSWLA